MLCKVITYTLTTMNTKKEQREIINMKKEEVLKTNKFYKELLKIEDGKWFRLSFNGRKMVANTYQLIDGNIHISRPDIGVIGIIGSENIDKVKFIGEE